MRSIQTHDRNPVSALVHWLLLAGVCNCQKTSNTSLDLWRHSIDKFTPMYLIIINHEKGILHNGLNICAETCHFLSIWFDISTRGSNWGTKHSVTPGEEYIWHAWHVGLRDEQKRGQWTLETHWDLAALWTTIYKSHQTQRFVFSPPVQKKYFIPTCSTFCTDHDQQKRAETQTKINCPTRNILKKWESVCWAWGKNMSVSQEMDISPLSEQSHNTCSSVPSVANVPLPISHAHCDSYEFRFSLRKPSMREWLHISTWLPVWVISISSAAKWLLVTKQTLCRLCGMQHCKANNNLGRRETSESDSERESARVRERESDRETDSSGLLRKITLMTLAWVYILHIHECYCGKFEIQICTKCPMFPTCPQMAALPMPQQCPLLISSGWLTPVIIYQ